MIRPVDFVGDEDVGKPRASGDDPVEGYDKLAEAA